MSGLVVSGRHKCSEERIDSRDVSLPRTAPDDSEYLAIYGGLEPFPKRLHPLRTEATDYRFQVCGAACRIEVRRVYSREAHPFRESL